MRKYGSTHKSGYVIGKAEKYWTLWHVEEPRDKRDWYGIQTVQNFNYLQNLSYDKDKALEKVKSNGDISEFIINEGLRGRGSYSNELGIEYNEDIFLFGKYKKRKFEDIDDVNYKRWYWSETKGTDKESPVLEKDLKDLLIKYNGEVIFIDDLEKKALKVYEEHYRRKGLFGNEGEKYKSFVRFRRHSGFDTTYGWMDIFEFVDPEGRLVYYKGSKELEVEKGVVYVLKGKIKHTKYYSSYHGKYVEETQIQYPKLKEVKNGQ